MSETTTTTKTETVNLGPDPTATHGELVSTTTTAVATQTTQQAVPAEFDEFALAVRRMLGLEDASEGEMQLFHHICQRSGLDPFAKEIYMIGRNTEIAVWEDVPETGGRRKVNRWVTKYTIQTSIHGIRRKAREIAAALGVTYKVDQPMWCGEDGQWREVWPEKTVPTAAKFTVYRDGEPNTFVAHYDEFVQESGSGSSRGPNSMWSKMPRNQLRKCAEFNAIQMAFPDQLGGLVFDEAAQPTVIEGEVIVEQKTPPQRARGVAALQERAAKAAEGKASPKTGPMTAESREKWLKSMFALFNKADAKGRDDQLIVIAGILGDDELLEHRDGMSDDELRAIVTRLNDLDKAGELANQVTEYLNAWDLRQAADESESAEDTLAGGESGEQLGLDTEK